MSNYYFCLDCEHIKTRMVPGVKGSIVKELSCPARFNPMEGKWMLEDGINPHECPRNEHFIELQKHNSDRVYR